MRTIFRRLFFLNKKDDDPLNMERKIFSDAKQILLKDL